jgi:hypothetical protein
MQKPMVQFLLAGRMDQVSDLMPSSIQKAVNGTPISNLLHVVDPVRLEQFIAFELTKLAAMVNVDQRLNLQPHQVPFIAKGLLETFKFENLADLSLCFKRGAMGLYGEIFRLDGAVITGWMQKYLEEKYQVIEDNLMKEKDSPFVGERKGSTPTDQSNPDRNLLSLLKTVVGDALPKSGNNAAENEYQRHKVENPHPVTSPEAIQAKLENIRRHQEKAFRDKYPTATDEEIKKLLGEPPF